MAVGRLVDAGVVERVGTGTRQHVRLNAAHPATPPLQALFRAERARFARVVSRLQALAREHAGRARAVWMTELPESGGLVVGVLAGSREVDATVEALGEAVSDLARREDIPVEVRGWTRPDLDALGQAAFPAFHRAVVLHGVLPDDGTHRPDRPSVRRRSHATVDEALRERARRVAAALGRRPELVRAAREEVAQRLATAPPQEARTLREWQQVLNAMSTPRLRRWLVDPGERATRLRQSMPVMFLRAADDPTGPTRHRP
ncbi:MAG: hypothetical protein HYW06_03865 [Gemmatimonadetes bacterium]|nr:hypothetical protein [Gemmatimonadota bacterium]